MFETILAVLVSLASILLILVVLLQSGKKAGLSGAIAGGSDTYMSKNKAGDMDQKLADSTKWIALAWIVLVLLMSLV
jgi:preprotein translocase subunit SecG